MALRDAINAGRLVGPRILASGRKLAQQEKNGYVQNLNPALAQAILQQKFLSFNGPDSARQAVKDDLFYDVDVIKVTVEDDTSSKKLTAKMSRWLSTPSPKAAFKLQLMGAWILSSMGMGLPTSN